METRLVKYLKDGDKLIGAVVGLPNGSVGVSICNDRDQFDKKHAVYAGIARAYLSEKTTVPHKWIKHSKASYLFLPEVVTAEIAIMEQRLQKYYKLESVPPKSGTLERVKLLLAMIGF